MSYPISKHEENEKLKRENVELKAMINELRDAMSHTIRKLGGHLTLETAVSKTPVQSLHDHCAKCTVSERSERDMAIAEAVREAFLDAWFGTDNIFHVARDIRNIDLAAIVKGVK